MAEGFFYGGAMPIFHECQRCTACCRWPGIVRLSDAEISQMAAFKGVSEIRFVQHFTRLADDRRGLVLNDNEKGECIFLEDNKCSVHPVKPQQCRDFPNLWNFPGFESVCKALPKIVNEAEYQQLVKAATGREIKISTRPETDGADSPQLSPQTPVLHELA
jgi:Fe-S-cluster containining protein